MDNSWLGVTCVIVTGEAQFKVITNLHRRIGPVLAYPNVLYGRHYWMQTHHSYLPMPVRHAIAGPRWVSATLGAPSNPHTQWLGDFDAWFVPSKSDEKEHGTTELVVVVRYRGSGGGPGKLVVVGGHRYHLLSWITCQRLADGRCDPSVRPWRLVRLMLVRTARHIQVPFGALIRLAVRHRLLPISDWWLSVALGDENYTYGRGETVRLHVWPPTR